MSNELKHIGLLGILAVVAIGVLGMYQGSLLPGNTNPSSGIYSLDLLKAQQEGNIARGDDEQRSLYTLARIYYISGDTDKALDTIAQYKEQYPDEKRIHYVAGLAHAYAGNFTRAGEEFQAFIDSGLATWPGYLDFAWVKFQQGSFDTASELLEEAVAQFGDNTWLNTSRGAVALAQGDTETAITYLEIARTQVAELTEEEWKENYSLNNPNNFSEEIAQMQTVIETNLAYAMGDDTPENIRDAIRAPFAGTSPLGVSGGIAVSACGDSCGTIQCISAANICGSVSTGTQSTCGGGCSASVPANPSGSCSVATACGVDATGYNGCNGQCNIVSYPFCTTTQNPDGDGAIEWITVGGGDGSGIGVTDVTCEIFASPTLVSEGASTVVRWISTETVSASISSSAGGTDSWSGTIGEQLTPPITQQTTFTLTCEGYDESTVTDSITVNVVPEWQEF